MNDRAERALIRPAPLSRTAASVGALVGILITLGVSTGLSGAALLWFPCGMVAVTGLLWNAARNQGAWLLEYAIVLEAVVGRAVIPLEEVIEVHIDGAMTTLGVRTSTRYVVQSIVTPVALGLPAGARDRTVRLFRNSDITCMWHDGLADVYQVASATSPFMWPGAVLGTLRRPLVWGSALAGLAYGLLRLFTGSV